MKALAWIVLLCVALTGCAVDALNNASPRRNYEAQIVLEPLGSIITRRWDAGRYVCELAGIRYSPWCYGDSTWTVRCVCGPPH